MMVIVPTLAPRQNRYQRVVGALVAGLEIAVAVPMAEKFARFETVICAKAGTKKTKIANRGSIEASASAQPSG